MRIRSFECEGDVLRFHVRHAHVLGGKATVDRRDVILSEAKKREELDRRAGVCHRDSNMIRIEYHLITPCHQRRALGRAGFPPPVSCRQLALPLLQGYQLAPSHGRRVGRGEVCFGVKNGSVPARAACPFDPR